MLASNASYAAMRHSKSVTFQNGIGRGTGEAGHWVDVVVISIT
jgi:hypothetical protein